MVRSRQHNLDIALKAYLLVVATVSALFSELFFLSSFFRALFPKPVSANSSTKPVWPFQKRRSSGRANLVRHVGLFECVSLVSPDGGKVC